VFSGPAGQEGTMSQQVIVGTVGRPHGLRGEVTVRPRTDRVEQRFAVGAQLLIDSRPITVIGSSWTQGRLIVGLAGVADRSAAEELRGLDLWADADGDDLDSEEYHDAMLIGLAVVDPDGAPLGTVTAVQHNPAQDLLTVRNEAGEWLVPFVSELVPQVDVPGGRLVVRPIPGLLSEVSDED
jgi:16S rRNA processing protein RimM